MQKSNLKLGELLLYAGKISKEQLNKALEDQKTTKMKLGEIIVNKGWLNLDEIVESKVHPFVKTKIFKK